MEDSAQKQLPGYDRYSKRTVSPILTKAARRYLEEEGAFLQLPSTTTDALIPIYNAVLNDLVPLVDGTHVYRDYSNGKSSAYLIRAMCMVVCKAPQAMPFLRITEGGPVLEPLEFSSKLLTGLQAAVNASLEPDRVKVIQILALMHLHNDGQGGTNRSSAHLSQAISVAWSMSLHWRVPNGAGMEQCDYLWWTLRNLDRLNKPVMCAAPFLIDDADIGLERIKAKRSCHRSQVMEVTLALGDLMTSATRIYKASTKTPMKEDRDFPSWAQITSGTSFDTFHKSHQCKRSIASLKV